MSLWNLRTALIRRNDMPRPLAQAKHAGPQPQKTRMWLAAVLCCYPTFSRNHAGHPRFLKLFLLISAHHQAVSGHRHSYSHRGKPLPQCKHNRPVNLSRQWRSLASSLPMWRHQAASRRGLASISEQGFEYCGTRNTVRLLAQAFLLDQQGCNRIRQNFGPVGRVFRCRDARIAPWSRDNASSPLMFPHRRIAQSSMSIYAEVEENLIYEGPGTVCNMNLVLARAGNS